MISIHILTPELSLGGIPDSGQHYRGQLAQFCRDRRLTIRPLGLVGSRLCLPGVLVFARRQSDNAPGIQALEKLSAFDGFQFAGRPFPGKQLTNGIGQFGAAELRERVDDNRNFADLIAVDHLAAKWFGRHRSHGCRRLRKSYLFVLYKRSAGMSRTFSILSFSLRFDRYRI